MSSTLTGISFAPPSDLAVLAGAGISRDAPSNLPDGGTFMREVLKRVAPPGVDPSWVASAMELPTTRLRRPGEFLRFEMLMHELRQHGLDPDLRVLDCYDECNQPNFNHFALADLIRNGAVVITTNFDRLIELAWTRLPETGGKELRVAAFDEEFDEEYVSLPENPTLWKIHGSLTVGQRDTRESIQATMTSMLSSSMTEGKREFLSSVLRTRDLVVFGYSGYDDLDMIPVLSNTVSQRKLYWINHSPQEDHIEVQNASQVLDATPLIWSSDAVGRERIWFVADPAGEPIRSANGTILITAHTRQVVQALAPADNYPVEKETAYRFGSDYPRETSAYFEAWEHRLKRCEAGRLEVVTSIFQLRRFRAEIREELKKLDNRLTEIRRCSDDPHDHLQLLIEEYNDLSASSPDDPGSNWNLTSLKARARSLSLTPADQGHQLRLLACISWILDGEEWASQEFAEAAQFDRDHGQLTSELATLTTWRGHAGFSPWGDFIPEEYSNRIDEIANHIGYLPVIWTQELLRYSQVMPEDSNLPELFEKFSRMRRHSIDVGDVLGEARASVLIGRIYLMDNQPHLATGEFLRASELNRLLEDEFSGGEAAFGLTHCQTLAPGQAERMLPWLRQSIWAGRDERT